MCLLVDGLSAAGRIHCAVINALIAQGREGVVRLSQPRHRVFQTPLDSSGARLCNPAHFAPPVPRRGRTVTYGRGESVSPQWIATQRRRAKEGHVCRPGD